MFSSLLYLGLPLGLVVKGFHLNIFLVALASGILCMVHAHFQKCYRTIDLSALYTTSFQQKNTVVFTSDVGTLTYTLPVCDWLFTLPFSKKKLSNPLHIRCHPAPSDLNLVYTPLILLQLSQLTLTETDSSQTTYQTSCLATTVYDVVMSQRIPASLKSCAAVREVVSLHG